jgi:DNA-directed RNA polymerase sigma subunit (sigma70/sigma32)
VRRLTDDAAASYTAIGRALGLSVERVRQIEREALRKLRKLARTSNDGLAAWAPLPPHRRRRKIRKLGAAP